MINNVCFIIPSSPIYIGSREPEKQKYIEYNVYFDRRQSCLEPGVKAWCPSLVSKTCVKAWGQSLVSKVFHKGMGEPDQISL